jgi:hypothetical protein
MRKKWLSYMSSGLAVVFILYIIPMFFLDTFFLYFRKDIYVLIGVLLSFLLYICSWKEFNRIRERDAMFKNFKFSFISNLLFFTFFLSIPLLAPYPEVGSFILGSLSIVFFAFVSISIYQSMVLGPVKGHLMSIILFCIYAIISISIKTGLNYKILSLLPLAYFIASMLEMRRNRFPSGFLLLLMGLHPLLRAQWR